MTTGFSYTCDGEYLFVVAESMDEAMTIVNEYHGDSDYHIEGDRKRIINPNKQ